MNKYQITVIYAAHNKDHVTAFPAQTIPASKIQIIPVCENDNFHPRKQALNAINRALGTYTILLDEQDQFSEQFLAQLIPSLDGSDSAFVLPKQQYQSTIHPGNQTSSLSPFSGKEDVIDVRTAPGILPFELAGILFRTEILQRLLPDCLTSEEPEKLLFLKLLSAHPIFSFAADAGLTYAWPRESDFLYDPRSYSKDWYLAPLQRFLLPLLQTQIPGLSPVLLQKLALIMILCRLLPNLNNRDRGLFTKEEIFPDYMQLLTRILSYVDEEIIIHSPLLSSGHVLTLKLLLLRIKKNDYTWYPDTADRDGALVLLDNDLLFAGLSDLHVQLSLIDYTDGHLEIDGSIPDLYHPNALSLYADFDGVQYPVCYNSRYSLSKCFHITYAKLNTFHVSIPVPPSEKDRILQFYLVTSDHKYVGTLGFPNYTSRFSKAFPHAYWRFGTCFSFRSGNSIHIQPARKLNTLYHELRLWREIWLKKDGAYRPQLPLKILNFLLRPYFSRKRIWLFFDKIYKGGDSAEYLYRYCKKQKDGIKKYYLLDEQVPDYTRMKQEGLRPLKRGSLLHRLVFLNADIVIASNSTVFPFNDYTFDTSFPIRGEVHFDVACVQHGMSIQKIAIAQNRLRDNIKLYFCASRYEIENLSKPIYDYADYDILKLTGVPRFDGLHDRHQKILLFSPTWRMNSAMPVSASEGVARDYNPNFRHTDYFKVYNSLMNDPRLLAAARQYGYRIQYVLHPIVSPQAEDFTKNDLVEIIPSTGAMSYETLFCEAALMVTDFSGVQFDFAYMRKPVVYLHHNDIPQHYENGTFFYDTMGFGEICHTNDELIDVLCEYMKHDCVMPQMYRERADDFFAFSDDHNCERIYPHLVAHEEKIHPKKRK